MPIAEHFPWISAGLAVLALVAGLPALVDLVCGRRREQALPREFRKALRANAEALARAAACLRISGGPGASREWGGIWDGCPGAWPNSGLDRDTLSGPEA